MIWMQVYVTGCAAMAALIAVALHSKGLTPRDLEELSGTPPGTAPIGMVLTIILWPIMLPAMVLGGKK